MYRILIAVVTLCALLLAVVQFASEALLSREGAAFSVPAHLSAQGGRAVYRAIERVAPASYAEAMLARSLLEDGNVSEALVHARRLPESATRNEFLARIALAQGDRRSAQRYFVAAGDYAAVQREVDGLAKTDVAGAFALELEMNKRLQETATHPDAYAESLWELGQLATQRSIAERSPQWAQRAMEYDRLAIRLAPLSGKYWIAAGTQAYLLREFSQAREYFERAADVDPASADAFAGLALVAQAQHQQPAAQSYAARSRALGRSSLLRTPKP